MDEVVILNTPLARKFKDEGEANKYLKRFTRLKRFKDHQDRFQCSPIPDAVTFRPSSMTSRCTSHAKYGRTSIELATDRRHPLEILHILAHFLQPPGSKWHGGEFSTIFLDLCERQGGSELKREVKDIMLKYRIKTSVESDESRLKQSKAYYDKKIGALPQNLMEILHDINKLEIEVE